MLGWKEAEGFQGFSGFRCPQGFSGLEVWVLLGFLGPGLRGVFWAPRGAVACGTRGAGLEVVQRPQYKLASC